ncbi:hypothetical protein ACIQU6_38680 [Streptomyces sp. NPDC090442]|uniref:hypothetical protein n=1 Tax=Streptomyces sp. NPDC090442 TaxID=3365962 RepID=UPI00381F0F97
MVIGSFRPFEIDELDVLEREVGLLLPASRRSFLQAVGGESFAYSVLLPDCGPEPLQSFGDLYELGRDSAGEYDYGTLLGEYRRSSDWWVANEVQLLGLLPIARDAE